MSKIDDGGPAFPQMGYDPWGKVGARGGMSKREYFFAHLMGRDGYDIEGALLEADAMIAALKGDG